jgi:DNA-binding transcriptional ArsR family regulator
MSNQTPSETPFLIQDLETLRVIADPLRNQTLEILIEQPQTVGEAAVKLGLSPSKLYYHFSLLEKHGLIRVCETRTVGNLLEKVYQAVSSRLEIADELLNFKTPTGQESVFAMLLSMLDTTREDLQRSLQARAFELEHGAVEHPRRVIVNRNLSHLSESKAQELQERLCALMEEFIQADLKERALQDDLEEASQESSGDAQKDSEGAPQTSAEGVQAEETHLYAFTVAFYPTFYYPEGGK